MQKVIDYKLVIGAAPQLLEPEVKAAMNAGWVPSGTVVAFDNMLVQAMVKFEEA